MTIMAERSEQVTSHALVSEYHQKMQVALKFLNSMNGNRDYLRQVVQDVRAGKRSSDEFEDLIARARQAEEVSLSSFGFEPVLRKLEGMANGAASPSQISDMRRNARNVTTRIASAVGEITLVLDFMEELRDVDEERIASPSWQKRIATFLNRSLE